MRSSLKLRKIDVVLIQADRHADSRGFLQRHIAESLRILGLMLSLYKTTILFRKKRAHPWFAFKHLMHNQNL